MKAHRAGIEIARPIYTIEVAERPDIVVASSHPADRDLWQGFKAVNNCGMMARDGGTLILLIPAPEGIAPDHTQLVDFGTTPGDKVLDLVTAGEVHDEVAAATYLAFDQTRKRLTIALVSDGIPDSEARQIGITCDNQLQRGVWRKLLHPAWERCAYRSDHRRAQTSWRTLLRKEGEQICRGLQRISA